MFYSDWSKCKKWSVGVVGIFCLYGLYKIFLAGPEVLKVKKNLFDYATVSKQDIKSVVSATGTINPVNVVSVGAQVSGMVDKIYVDYNDVVKEGQLLAQIDKSLLIEDINATNARLAQAKARYDLAKLDKERTEQLFNAGYIAKLELDNAVTNFASAKAEYGFLLVLIEIDKLARHQVVDRRSVEVHDHLVDGVVEDRSGKIDNGLAVIVAGPDKR